MKAELQRRQTNLDKVAQFFQLNPKVWIEARHFEQIGGRQAWRSRIAECRTKRGMYIENRQERSAANTIVGSWYRYLPSGKPLGPDAATPRSEKHPARQTDLPL